MPDLKFYKTESVQFEREESIKLTDQQARKIAKKLTKHYGIQLEKLKFHGHRQSGTSWNKRDAITVSHDPNIVLLCHEIAHQIQRQQNGKSRHDKKLLALIKKMLRYCMKKKLWRT